MTKTTYRMLWLAAALVGAANFLLFWADMAPGCGIAAVVCALVCGVTYEGAWSGK